jgi:hypothetical protein
VKHRLGEQDVAAHVLQAVLEQPVCEDDARAGCLAAVAHHLAQKTSVVGHDLQVEVPDAPAGVAGAGVVRRQLALALPEGGDRMFQSLQHDRGRYHGSIRAHREDRVAFHLLDLQGRRQVAHDLSQQLGDDRRAVLQLGRGDERRETRDVRQDQHPVFRVTLHAS